jgi:hypothetical protein
VNYLLRIATDAPPPPPPGTATGRLVYVNGRPVVGRSRGLLRPLGGAVRGGAGEPSGEVDPTARGDRSENAPAETTHVRSGYSPRQAHEQSGGGSGSVTGPPGTAATHSPVGGAEAAKVPGSASPDDVLTARLSDLQVRSAVDERGSRRDVGTGTAPSSPADTFGGSEHHVAQDPLAPPTRPDAVPRSASTRSPVGRSEAAMAAGPAGPGDGAVPADTFGGSEHHVAQDPPAPPAADPVAARPDAASAVRPSGEYRFNGADDRPSPAGEPGDRRRAGDFRAQSDGAFDPVGMRSGGGPQGTSLSAPSDAQLVIGRIDVTVEAPPPTNRPAAPSTSSGSALSRRYARGL